MYTRAWRPHDMATPPEATCTSPESLYNDIMTYTAQPQAWMIKDPGKTATTQHSHPSRGLDSHRIYLWPARKKDCTYTAQPYLSKGSSQEERLHQHSHTQRPGQPWIYLHSHRPGQPYLSKSPALTWPCSYSPHACSCPGLLVLAAVNSKNTNSNTVINNILFTRSSLLRGH